MKLSTMCFKFTHHRVTTSIPIGVIAFIVQVSIQVQGVGDVGPSLRQHYIRAAYFELNTKKWLYYKYQMILDVGTILFKYFKQTEKLY